MSSTGGQWEVVGGKSAKHKHGNENKLSKTQKKKFADTMPKIEPAAPLKESQTIYDAFIEKESKVEEVKKPQPPPAKVNGVNEGKPKKQQTAPKSKSKEKKKDSQKSCDISQALSQLRPEDLEAMLVSIRSQFPKNPSIWLKDLAAFLNAKLNVPINDPIFVDKPFDYPYCFLDDGAKDIISNTLKDCNDHTLKLFLDHCLQGMVQDMHKGLPTFGYRLCLQCLAIKTPLIVTSTLQKFVEMRSTYQNRHPACLSILWVAGQAGVKDMIVGLKVWLELMLPVVGVRAYTKYTIDYLENLLKAHPGVKSANDVLGVRQFFPILDFVYGSPNLPAHHLKQLHTLYVKLKALSYGEKPEMCLRLYFPSYLRRLNASVQPELKKELLSSLVECLCIDKQCYSVWRQLYTKHLLQSSILMHYLSETWEKLPSSLPHKLLKETVTTFRVTNDELQSQGKSSIEGFTECVHHCNELLQKMNGWKFPWKHLLFLIIASLTALLVYDVNLHGTFQKSKTGRVLKDIGVLAVWDQAYGKIAVYSKKVFWWMEDNLPVYYKKLCEVVGPYLELFWDRLFVLLTFCWESTQPVRDWLSIKLPPLLQWVNDNFPLYADKLLTNLNFVLVSVGNYLSWLSLHVVSGCKVVGTWLVENVLTGSLSPQNLQTYASTTVDTCQKYALSAYYWLSQQISSIISSK